MKSISTKQSDENHRNSFRVVFRALRVVKLQALNMNEITDGACVGAQYTLPFFSISAAAHLNIEGWGWNFTFTAVDCRCKFPKVYFCLYISLKHASFLVFPLVGVWVRLLSLQFVFLRINVQSFPSDAMIRTYIYSAAQNFSRSPLVLSILHKKYSFDCWFGWFLGTAFLPFGGNCWIMADEKLRQRKFWKFSLKITTIAIIKVE